MKKVKEIHDYKDLIRRSKSIKNIYDVFDMLHEKMTANEVKQACLNLYALKIKENPNIIFAFKRIIPNDLPYSSKEFYQRQQQIIRSNPMFFSEEEFRKTCCHIDDMPKETSALFMQTYEVIVLSKKYFEKYYKKNPFNILIAVYHELEHLSQKYEQDIEMRTIFNKNRLSNFVVNEKLVHDLLEKNNHSISKAMKEFEKYPDNKKYVDLFDFVNINRNITGASYDYCTFDECLEFDLPMIEDQIDYNTFKVVEKQLTLASSNFYINSPMEQDARLHEIMFGFNMSSYANLFPKQSKRRAWILKNLKEASYNAFRASDHEEAEGLFEEMMFEKTPNQKLNYAISQEKNKVETRQQVRKAIISLFDLPVKAKFTDAQFSALKKVGIYFFIACYENGLISEKLSCDCIEKYNKLITEIKYKVYYRDNKTKLAIENFIKKDVTITDDDLEVEIIKDGMKKSPYDEYEEYMKDKNAENEFNQ